MASPSANGPGDAIRGNKEPLTWQEITEMYARPGYASIDKIMRVMNMTDNQIKKMQADVRKALREPSGHKAPQTNKYMVEG